MQDTFAALKTALRVLGAITEYRPPAQADVDELRRLMPMADSFSVDELACEVIQLAMRAKARARSASEG